MNKTIVFVTPTFSRTGSEIALANLLCSADAIHTRTIIFAYHGIGELARQMPSKVRVILPFFSKYLALSKLIEILTKRIFAPIYLRYVILRFKPKLVYINTTTLAKVLNIIEKYQIPTILHTHELEPMLAGLTVQQTARLIEKPDFVIAASERAAQVFRTLGRTTNMAVIPSPIEFEALQKVKPLAEGSRNAHEPFTWLMAGSLDSNKNPVRFVEIAHRYLKKRKQDRFVWLGGQETGYSLYAKSLAKEYGLTGSISWVQPENHDDYLKRFAATNGVVITSDAESLSLVAIEALAMGKSVVSFDNGGTAEILGSRYGALVPRYDIELCVAKMTAIASGRLKFSPDQLRKRAREFDVSRVKDQWLQILESVTES